MDQEHLYYNMTTLQENKSTPEFNVVPKEIDAVEALIKDTQRLEQNLISRSASLCVVLVCHIFVNPPSCYVCPINSGTTGELQQI